MVTRAIPLQAPHWWHRAKDPAPLLRGLAQVNKARAGFEPVNEPAQRGGRRCLPRRWGAHVIIYFLQLHLMLPVCVRKFDVTGTVQKFLGLNRAFIMFLNRRPSWPYLHHVTYELINNDEQEWKSWTTAEIHVNKKFKEPALLGASAYFCLFC